MNVGNVGTEAVAETLLLGILLPAWVIGGLADWWFHRRSRIEDSSGWKESGLHVLLIGQGAVAVLAGLFFHINSLVILLMILMFVAHELTTTLDIGYAVPRRAVTAGEQRIHDYLTAIPMAALAVIVAMNPGDAMAIFKDGSGTADYSLRLREDHLPVWYLTAFMALSSLNALAYLEEFHQVRAVGAWAQRHIWAGVVTASDSSSP